MTMTVTDSDADRRPVADGDPPERPASESDSPPPAPDMAPDAVPAAVETTEDADSAPLPEALPVEWQARLWRDVPMWRAVLAVVTLGAVWVLIVLGLADLPGGPLAAAILCIVAFTSVEELFFPMRYRLTETEATARCLTRFKRMPWTAVNKCYVDRNGIKLSPFDRQTKLETFRGIFLRFNDADGFTRDRLVPLIKGLRDRAHARR